jgi:hypothetical protein
MMMSNNSHSPNNNNNTINHRTLAASESAKILNISNQQRESAKSKMLAEQASFRMTMSKSKSQGISRSVAKSQRSPFHIDLVAENERISERNEVRGTEIVRRQVAFAKARETARNGIVLRALLESSDIQSLRVEKRGIILEERRLQALLDIEKTGSGPITTGANSHSNPRREAQRAEKWRFQGQREYRRKGNKELIDDHKRREMELVRSKHEMATREGVPSTFSSYGS